jgi:hypothetical protein
MPAVDRCHEQVVRAFVKDGWVVDTEQYGLRTARGILYVDIAVHRSRGNGTEMRVLLIEAKCFPRDGSTLNDLYVAIGQYLIYRNILTLKANSAELYLAIPAYAYSTLFQPLALPLLDELSIKTILIDMEQERIERWRP